MQQKFLQQYSTVAVIIIITVSSAEASIKLVIKWLIVERAEYMFHQLSSAAGCARKKGWFMDVAL